MVKTVRFQQLVEVAGKPETHLVLVEPAKDRALQSAMKANRVVTVHQSSTGSRTDHGVVGFDPGPSRQFLVFPRGVGRFKARRIVGIKYDLLAGDESPGKARRRTARRKRPDRKAERSKAYPPLRVLEQPKPIGPEESQRSRPKKSRAVPDKRSVEIEAKKRKQEERKRAEEERARKEHEKREQEKQARAEARALAALTGKVRKALEYLEAGKRSPALKLLRRTVQAEL